MKIKNLESIIDEFTNMLMQFDKDCNKYQTDVYLYYNEESQTAELDEFVNVGGNSWLDDDHYRIYIDNPHNGDMWDWYQSEEELANALEISIEQLENEVVKYLELDEEDTEDYELTYSDARGYIKTTDNYMKKLTEAYYECIEDMRPDYYSKASEIINDFVDNN